MRGKAVLELLLIDNFGITPAYAGKRPVRYRRYGPCWDHPRVCGEKLYSFRISVGFLGSPPRMRGKAYFQTMLVLNQGITPAYAGKRRQCPLGE